MAEPELIGQAPPPLARDWRLACWIDASVVSWMGSTAWGVALAWEAVRTMPPGRAGMVVAVATIPQALVTLAGGVIADRCDTRRVLVAAQLAHTLTLLVGAVLWGRVPAFGLLLGLGVCFGVVTGLSSPAGATLGRQLVVASDLGTVAGWDQIGSRLARMAGAPVGAVLVAMAGLPAVMVLDAATFLVAAAVLVAVVRPRFRLHGAVTEPWGASIGEGWRYLRTDATALVFVLGLCGLNIFSSPLTSLGVPLRITASGWPSEVLGIAEAVFSAAALAGSVIGLRWAPRRPARAAYLLLVAQGVAYAGIAVDRRVAVLGAMALIGVSAGCASVWLSALFVHVVQPAFLGRVASVSTLGDLLLVPLATPAFGALSSAVGIGRSPVVLAALMVAMCLAVVARADIRHLARP